MHDQLEITDLVNRLGRWLDEKRWDEADALFTADAAVSTPGGTAQGRAALVAQAQRNHHDHTTQHLITNVVVDLDGDRATAGANLLVTFADGLEPRVQMGERYAFGARRTEHGWRLDRVQVRPLWRTENASIRRVP